MTKTAKTAKTAKTVTREVVSEKVDTISALRTGAIYTRDAISALFARNDSNVNAPAGTLKVSDNETHALYKVGTFAGKRTWFVPVCEGLLCIGETMQVDKYWYSDAKGTAYKTRDNVLRESLKKYLA